MTSFQIEISKNGSQWEWFAAAGSVVVLNATVNRLRAKGYQVRVIADNGHIVSTYN